MTQDSDQGHSLSPVLQSLAAALIGSGEQPALEAQALAAWGDRLTALPADQHDDLLAELIGLAVWLQRRLGDRAQTAIDQLAALAGRLAPDRAAGDPGAELPGPDPALAAVTGQTATSKRPVGSGPRPDGAINPLALRLGRGRKKK